MGPPGAPFRLGPEVKFPSYPMGGLVFNPKQPRYKKECCPQKGCGEKDVNPRWRPRNGCDGRLTAESFNNDNSDEFCIDSQSFFTAWLRYHFFLDLGFLTYLFLY